MVINKGADGNCTGECLRDRLGTLFYFRHHRLITISLCTCHAEPKRNGQTLEVCEFLLEMPVTFRGDAADASIAKVNKFLCCHDARIGTKTYTLILLHVLLHSCLQLKLPTNR